MLLRRHMDEARNEHIDMTPMVDVVFQLMTFMLFSIQMTGGEQVDVPKARHGVGVEETAATVITLTEGNPPVLVLGNGPGPAATLDQVRKAVAEGVTAGRSKVVLQADGDVPHGEVVKLARTLTELEGVSLHIGVQEPS